MKLLPCPFCGSDSAPSIMSDEEMGGERDDYWAVCCDFNDGGCGATSGYEPTQEQAQDQWNKRIKP